MKRVRKRLKEIVPKSLLDLHQTFVQKKQNRRFASLDSAAIFDTVYKRRYWGGSPDGLPCSGSGSRDPTLVAPYVDALNAFLGGFPQAPRVVDIGCGDFFVSGQLVGNTSQYVACDVSKFVIETLKGLQHDPKVTFVHLDATRDELPDGDVVIIRQVLQHLCNGDIARILPKLARYKYVILAEHLPCGDFAPNLDQATGPDIRFSQNSGVVITKEPFSFTCVSESVLCEVRLGSASHGLVRTILYRMRRE